MSNDQYIEQKLQPYLYQIINSWTPNASDCNLFFFENLKIWVLSEKFQIYLVHFFHQCSNMPLHSAAGAFMDDGSLIICGGYRRGNGGLKSPYDSKADKNFTRCSNNQIRLLKSNFIKMVPYFCTSTVSVLFKLGVLKQSGIYIYEIKSMLIILNNSNNHLQQKHNRFES